MKALLNKSKQVYNDALGTLRSLEQLLEATSLLVVSYFSYFTVTHTHVSVTTHYLVGAASVFIGVRGAYEFVSYVNKRRD